MRNEEYVLVEGQSLQEKRTLIEELAYKVKNIEHQLDYELDVSRADFDKKLGSLAVKKAEKLEGEKRKFQEFHISFKAERRRLIGELEE